VDVESCSVCSQAVSTLGGIGCFTNESLQQFADKAVQLYGDGHNISVASVGSLGSIVGQSIHATLLQSYMRTKYTPRQGTSLLNRYTLTLNTRTIAEANPEKYVFVYVATL